MSNVSFFDHGRNRIRTGLAEIDRKWGWYLALGVLLVVLGFIALGSAFATTMVSVMMLGGLLLVGGVAMVVLSFVTGSWSGFFVTLAAGALSTIAGIAMLSSPPAAAAAITLMLGAILVAEGIFRAVASVFTRFPSWGWALVSGVVSILIGGYLLANWQVLSLVFLGLIIGIDLIIHGVSWIAFSLTLHSLARALNVRETDLGRAA
jgi:uncharacterized membrane protein HdeD (DUF308 family)